MLGWGISIAAHTPGEVEDRPEIRNNNMLAKWEVGPGGLDWITAMVKSGKAEQHSYNGYPNRYTAKAGDLLPLLQEGPPSHTGPAIIGDDYAIPQNWRAQIVMFEEKIAACEPHQTLTIDAWDLS